MKDVIIGTFAGLTLAALTIALLGDTMGVRAKMKAGAYSTLSAPGEILPCGCDDWESPHTGS